MITQSEYEVKLTAEIDRVLDKMKPLDPRSEEYVDYADRLTKLSKLLSDATQLTAHQHPQEPETPSRLSHISPDTALVVAANLIGIFWITAVEREFAITTKAQSFVLKPR